MCAARPAASCAAPSSTARPNSGRAGQPTIKGAEHDGRAERGSVAILFTDGVEQVELTRPLEALRDAGVQVDLIARQAGDVQMFEHLDGGATISADRAVGDADAADHDGLVLRSGVANPDALRTDPATVSFVRSFFSPPAASCGRSRL